MRKIASLTLIFSGFVELITSIVLYILPAGRVAYWTDYRLVGLSKTQWSNIHITVGTLFLVMALIHIYLNWRPILAYLKNKAKNILPANRQMSLALLLTIYVTVGTLYNLPPMNYVIHVGEYFTEQANAQYGEPPYGHAELSSLKMFTRKMYLDLDQAQSLLIGAGIKITSSEQTLLDIAQANNTTPKAIYSIMQSATDQKKGNGLSFPESPPPGFGTKTIHEVCATFALPEDALLAHLQKAGMSFSAEESIKDGAAKNHQSPMAVFELIHDFATAAQNTSK
jgi:hypothetical protein